MVTRYVLQPARIGTGNRPQSKRLVEKEFGNVEIVLATADINRSTEWCIFSDRHAVIVHLGGRMDVLETELDGHGGCSGPAIPGEIWSIPAGQVYRSYARGTTISYAAVYWNCDSQRRDVRDEIRGVAGFRNKQVHRTILRIINHLQDNDYIDDMMGDELSLELLNQLWDCLLQGCHQHQRPIPPLTAVQSRLIREYILDSIGMTITIADLSALAGLSVHHFLVAFRKSFATTPAQYLLDQRVRFSQWQLLHTTNDITEIALRSGFSSHSHLTTVFQKRIGTSPSRYRREASGRLTIRI